MIKITSKDNPRIKDLIKLKKGSSSDSEFLFIEGVRVCIEAFESGIIIKSLFLTEKRIEEIPKSLIGSANETIIISENIVSKVSSTVNSQGVFAIIKSPLIKTGITKELLLGKRYIICESVSDPGNLGSIIRSADAFGFDGVIMTEDTVSPFNDKVIRSSAGSIFHIKLIIENALSEALNKLRNGGFKIYSTALTGKDISENFSFKLPHAIIVGNEGSGVTDDINEKADHIIRIPMDGKAESLNVACATAILCFYSSIKFDGSE